MKAKKARSSKMYRRGIREIHAAKRFGVVVQKTLKIWQSQSISSWKMKEL